MGVLAEFGHIFSGMGGGMPVGAPAMGMPGMGAPAMAVSPYGVPGMAAPAVAVNLGPQRCFKCEGKGFFHDSSMPHDKPDYEKCFFCKPCSACHGGGAIEGAHLNPMGGVSLGAKRCFKCEGKGFTHDYTMPHDKDPDEKCF